MKILSGSHICSSIHNLRHETIKSEFLDISEGNLNFFINMGIQHYK